MHCHAYGDAARVPGLVAEHTERIRRQIARREEDEVGVLMAEAQPAAERLAYFDKEIALAHATREGLVDEMEIASLEKHLRKLEKGREKPAARVAERDERIAEARRRAEDDRCDLGAVGDELSALYTNPDELLKHVRVVGMEEMAENEWNLNIPRYVDTFEPEPRVDVNDALRTLHEAEAQAQNTALQLSKLLKVIGYAK